ncbi:putative LysR-gltR family transcriptional regulator [Paenibacillus sp. FSL R7-277]|uniref:LysR family transcriptional regulator n=1 Tax=unclassified Paenibacillus TaxID=185978 RepID=UPI0003E2ACD1|nr:LysR family transcriptional regulator [Paenibacillus sp. FSL R7-277]ETT75744.1 putative LysR-gltR family transcriptional regulator [Paenibacillus sp. FSL R7-277]
MHIENMRAFMKVAELRSMTAAANELNHLQSNITNKIKNIEKHFEAKLFYRHSYGVELTPDGERLYAQFKKIILLWEETEELLAHKEEHILIGIMQSSFPLHLNNIAKEFHQAFPNKRLSLMSGSTDELISKILKGELNIAYITELENAIYNQSKSMLAEMLTRDRLVFTGNTKGKSLYRLLSEEPIYVFSKQCSSYQALMSLMADFDVHNASISEVNIVETLLEICSNGFGIGIIPESLALKYHYLNYQALPDGYSALRRTLIYHPEHTLSSAEKWFIEKSKSLLQQ